MPILELIYGSSDPNSILTSSNQLNNLIFTSYISVNWSWHVKSFEIIRRNIGCWKNSPNSNWLTFDNFCSNLVIIQINWISSYLCVFPPIPKWFVTTAEMLRNQKNVWLFFDNLQKNHLWPLKVIQLTFNLTQFWCGITKANFIFLNTSSTMETFRWARIHCH